MLQAQSVWNVTNGTWNTAANWLPSGVPVSGNALQLQFNAASGSYTSTNDIGALTLNRLTVNNTGTGTITLAASASANTLTFAGTNPALDITGTVRFTGFMAGSGTITKVGSGTFIHDSDNSAFTGTLIINEGRFSNWGGTSSTALTNNFNPVSIVVNNGAVYQFGNAGAGDPNLPNSTYITVNPGGLVSWQEPQTLGGFHLLGGRIELLNGNATANGTTELNWTEGTIAGNAVTGTAYAINGSAVINKTTGGTLTLEGAAAISTTGGLKISEGTVVMPHALNLGTAPLTLGNLGTTGTLEYQGASATRAGNITRPTGATGVINVTQPSTILTLSGAVSGMGRLVKSGPGTLNITGAWTSTGLTQVEAGTLRINPITSSGAFTVADSATLAVNSGTVANGLTVGTLSLGEGSTLLFELNASNVPSQPLVTVQNAFMFGENSIVKLTNNQNFANGLYVLVDYEGFGIESGLNLQLAGRTLGSLVYDTDNTQILLNITGTDKVKWTGALGSAWDVGTAANVSGTNNWKLVTGGTATNFIDTDTVLFDDTASGFNVSLAGEVKPFSVTVNATADYTFSGAGKITGATNLLKNGTGTLVLATDNDYSGGTSVAGGALQLGNGGTKGSFTGDLLLQGSTLAFNRSDDFVFANNMTLLSSSNTIKQLGTGTATVNSRLALAATTLNLDGPGTLNLVGSITGTGVINMNGTGLVNLHGAHTGFTGTLNINSGVVQLTDTGASGDINAVSIVVNNGGTFIFGPDGNPDLPGSTMITVNTGGLFELRTGESYGGIVLNGGEYRVVTSANTGVSTSGEASTAGKAVFDLRSGFITASITGTGNGAILNQSGGGVLAKTTPGTVTIGSGVTMAATLDVQIREGTLAMPTSTVPATGTAVNGTGTALAGFTLGADSGTQGTLRIEGAGSANSARAVSLLGGGGNITVVEQGTSLTLSGAISGAGALTKTGAGTLNLNGTLSATGLTSVHEGTLRLKQGTVAGALATQSDATLAVSYNATAASLNVPSLTLADDSTLQLELASSSVPSVSLVQVTGNNGLSVNGDVILRLSNSQLFSNGTYTLIDYAGSAITSGFTLKFDGRTTGSLIYDTAATQIQMTVTGTDSVKWTGAVSNIWDIGSEAGVGGTNNWKLVNAGTATNYIERDIVVFDDTASNRSVQLDAAVRPFSVTVDTASGYTIAGSGKISGTTNLSKAGSGTLILATDNDYTGGTSVTGGTLQLGNGGTRGSITGALALSNSTLAFNRSDAFTFSTAVTLTGNNTLRQMGADSVMTYSSALAVGANTLTSDVDGTFSVGSAITGTGTLNKNGSGQMILLGSSGFTGTLNINGGIVQLTDKGAGGDLNAASIVVNNGGTFIFGPDGNPDLPANTFVTVNTGGLYEIYTGESYGGIILNGGEYRGISANSTGTATTVGMVLYDLRSGNITASGTGTSLGQSGGGVLAKTTAGTVTLGSGVSLPTTLTMQLKEGTLAMQVASLPVSGTAVNGTGSALATLDFGTATTQGTLQIQGLGNATTSRAVTLAAGGGRMDVVDSGSSVTLTGAITGTGPLVKSGAGVLNLNGTLNSTGTTTVEAGTLRIKSGTMAGGLATLNGGTLAVATPATAVSLNVPTLALAGSSKVQFELNSATIPAVPLINVSSTNGLSQTGAGNVVLRLTNGLPWATGTYTLLDYAGSSITSGFSLEIEGRSTGTLVYDAAGTKINANVVQGETIRWKGNVSSNWDAGTTVNVGGTQNWTGVTSLSATNFLHTDQVRFDDTASAFNVNLTTALRASAVTVDAAASYTFSGEGKITGAGSLTKTGAGTLLMTTDYDYTGMTTISAGRLQLGNGGTTGSIAGPVTLGGGTLAFNRSNAVTFAGAIAVNANSATGTTPPGAILVSGSGDVTLSGIISGAATRPLQMDGTGILYMRAVNTFTGTTVINSGTVSVNSNTSLGAATADVIINGGTLQLTASNLGTVNTDNRTVTIGAAGATLDFWVNQTFQGNGFTGTGNVVKTGAGRWTVGSNGSNFSGEILISQGSLLMTSAQLQSAKNLTIADGAQFIIDDDTAGTWRLATGGKFTFNGDGGGTGALRQYNGTAGTAANIFTTTFEREFVLNSASTVINTEAATGTILVTSNVTGTGGLTKIGPGTLTLTGTANSYAGGTVINGGTLIVNNTAGSGTGTGAVAIATGARLMGTGTIAGLTTIQSGAAIQSGTVATRGTLTFSSGLVLSNGSQADFRLSANGSNDKLVTGSLTLDPNAVIRILLGYTPAAGDTFDLFDWTSIGSGSDTQWVDNLDLSNAVLSGGLGWDTSLFNSQGVLTVVTLVPEPSRMLLLVAGLAFAMARRRRTR